MTTAGTFALDAGLHTYPAAGFDIPWNGWATPIVSRATLCALIANEDPLGQRLTLEFDGTIATVADRDPAGRHTDAVTLVPDADGLYHLVALGWTFHQIEERPQRDQFATPECRYTVPWQIDALDATTPVEAAQFARDAQTRPQTTATVFTVTDTTTGQHHLVDLAAQNPDQDQPHDC